MSQLAQHELETIVRMVVDRLRDSGAASPRASSTLVAAINQSSTSHTTPTAAIDPGVLVIPTSPVTLDDIDGKLAGIHTLRVAPRALLTPAVKDELRRAKIVIARGDTPTQPLQTKAGSIVAGSYNVIAVGDKSNIIQSVAKQIGINSLPTSLTMLDTVNQLAKLDANQRSIWCAPRPYAAMMAISQAAESLRVALVQQASDLKQAVLEIQPNLLVLDDARWSGYQVGRLIQAWARIEEQGGSK
jgi:hypothetical protein